ncbi:MAG: ATP-dependent helicase [Candidatus Woesearchaeota archaeon]|nr:ATP-dependent helicase [Candidatus Woesearchaeota archaeon]
MDRIKEKIKTEEKGSEENEKEPDGLRLDEIKGLLDERIYKKLKEQNIEVLRPCQKKAIEKGLLKDKDLVVCTPTASGKTLVAELAILNKILKSGKKAVYVLPLKALANEKFNEFSNKYSDLIKVGKSTSDIDSDDSFLAAYQLIIITPEKLDSLIRHGTPWIKDVDVFVIDEIHILNDPSRGPTTEVLIIMLKQICPDAQFLYLSATIGNPEMLADWLEAELVIDNWRPVKLKKGILIKNRLEFYDD